MTLPESPRREDEAPSSLLRAAIWVAIGALIAAAIVCVIWVLLGEQNGIIGRAFLTILLLVGFAGVAILDAHLAPRRPAWFALASMASWVIALLIGAVMIWMPERYPWGGFTRVVQFLMIVLILQLLLLHLRLYTKAFQRYVTTFTQVVAVVTIALVVALAALLIVPLIVGEWVRFADIYWRILVAVAILGAVGTALIPLVNILFAPKKPRRPAPQAPAAPYPVPVPYPAPGPGIGAAPVPVPQPQPVPQAESEPEPELLPWPNFIDGVTPLPMLPDGSPDWNAYYTGYPTPGAHVFTAPAPEAASEPAPEPAAQHHDPTSPPTPGYEGYPPPPPLPPRP